MKTDAKSWLFHPPIMNQRIYDGYNTFFESSTSLYKHLTRIQSSSLAHGRVVMHVRTLIFNICVLKKGISGRRTIARSLYRALYGVGVPVELIVDTPDTLRKYKDNKHLIYSDISR